MPETTSPQWRIETEYIQSCNCDYGCPCNFNALPTYGNCEALVGYRIIKGNFAETKLDGVAFALGAWWPKAIHFGDGIAQIYIDKKASAQQIKAIEEITSGKHGGAIFAIFASTFKEVKPTVITTIEFHYDPYDAWFSVEGAGEVRSGHILNPITNDPWEGEILVPGGIGFKRGTVTSVDWQWQSGDIHLKHEKKNGHASITTLANEGCIA